jgi:hypothetical protein
MTISILFVALYQTKGNNKFNPKTLPFTSHQMSLYIHFTSFLQHSQLRCIEYIITRLQLVLYIQYNTTARVVNITYKSLSPFFHILLTSTNILIERNEICAILDFAIKIILCMPLEISRLLETFKASTNQYLVSNKYFYMVNPCCDVNKTTVNETNFFNLCNK